MLKERKKKSKMSKLMREFTGLGFFFLVVVIFVCTVFNFFLVDR